MGTYLLCTGPLAAHPYQIEETGLRIWSAEELCYYMYHSTALLHEGFLKDSLIDFIAKELKLPESAERIRRFRDSQADLTVKLVTVLQEFRYYNEEDIRVFQTMMEERKKKSPLARELDRADALFQRKKYQAAVDAYQDILNGKKLPSGSEDLCVSACLHMASAYARLYLFEDAMDCLVQAWHLKGDPAVVEKIYALAAYQNLEVPEEIQQEADSQIKVKAGEQLAEAMRMAELHLPTGKIAAIQSRDSIRREEGMKEYISELRREYRISEG